MKTFLFLLVIILCVAAEDKKRKKDKNKCGRRNGGCDHDCNPKTGTCSCDKGYRLSSNGKSCTHKNVIACKKAIGNKGDFGKIVLALHNCLRQKHVDTKDLGWNNKMAKEATDWAKFAATHKIGDHQAA